MSSSRVDRDLIAAAEWFERTQKTRPALPVYHLLDVVSAWLGASNFSRIDRRYVQQRDRYHRCAKRLFDCIGTDLADFTREEVVDMLVAASYWRGR